MSSKKQLCVDCHFFVKSGPEMLPGTNTPYVSLVSPKDREKARKDDFSWHQDPWAISCSYGVWDEGVGLDRAKRYELLVQTDRKDSCFFWKVHPGMLLPAARILQERHALQQDAKIDRLHALWGIWVAAIGLVLSTALGIWNAFEQQRLSVPTDEPASQAQPSEPTVPTAPAQATHDPDAQPEPTHE